MAAATTGSRMTVVHARSAGGGVKPPPPLGKLKTDHGCGTLGKKAKNGSSERVGEPEQPLVERDRVADELTVANRGELPVCWPLPARGFFHRGRGKEGGGDARRGGVRAFEGTPYARRGECRAPQVPTVTATGPSALATTQEPRHPPPSTTPGR